MAACSSCKKPIQNGTEAAKKATTWRLISTRELVVSCMVDGLPEPDPKDRKLVGVRHYKALTVSTPVLTRGGFVPAYELTVGDAILSPSGEDVKIEEVLEWEPREVWHVQLRDGSSIHADAEHLWTVRRNNGKRFVDVETQCLRVGDVFPALTPYDGDVLPQLPPYVLGALLGDGCFTWTQPQMVTFDEQIKDIVKVLVPSARPWRKVAQSGREGWQIGLLEMRRPVVELGLWGLHGWQKFVPEECFSWSAVDRLALLRGLMDTDGSRGATQSIFVSASEALARGVQRLTWSLGGRATVWRTAPRAWMVSVVTPENPFALARKAEKWTRARISRTLEFALPLGVTEEMRCFVTDAADGLFVAGDFIPTHNCFKAEQKHLIRGGDPIRGRRMGDIPTAYEIAALTANQDDLTFLGISEAEARKMNTRQLTTAVEAQREAMIARAAATERVSVEEMYARVQAEATRIARERDKGYREPHEAQWPAAEPLELDVAHAPRPAEPTAINP